MGQVLGWIVSDFRGLECAPPAGPVQSRVAGVLHLLPSFAVASAALCASHGVRAPRSQSCARDRAPPGLLPGRRGGHPRCCDSRSGCRSREYGFFLTMMADHRGEIDRPWCCCGRIETWRGGGRQQGRVSPLKLAVSFEAVDG